MDATKGGNINIDADKNITANDLNANNVDLKSGDHIIVTGDNNITDTFKAESENYMIIGNEKDSFNSFVDTTLNAKNVELKSNNGNIGIAAVVTADDKIAITAGNGSIYTAANSIASDKNILNATEYELTAKDEIADIVPTESRIAYEFIDAVKNGRTQQSTDKVAIKGGELTINADTAGIKSEEDLNINKGNVNDLDIKGNNSIKVDGDVNFDKLKVDAKDVELDRNGSYTLDETKNIELKGENSVTIKAEKDLIIKDIETGNGKIIDAPNQNYEAGRDINFVGDNKFDGDVTVKSQNNGNINVTGDKTTVTNGGLTVQTKGDVDINNVDAETHVIVKDAHDININNTNTDHLGVINPSKDEQFHEVHIANTNANTTEFVNGEDVYINLTNSSIMGNNRDAIINTGNDVDRFHFFPTEDPTAPDHGGGMPGFEIDDNSAATRLMNEFRTSGVDTIMGEDFAPIAFAAHEGRKPGIVRKRIGEAVYKDLEETVHVTERFDMHD